ncbi:Transcription factor bye1 [Rhizina undulata]
MFIDTDKFELPEDVSIEEYAERLGIEIEHHIYLRFYKPGALTKEYQSQTRSVGFNIKENEVLCEELVHQRLSPEKLASMNSEQLAKKELQEFRMQVRIQSEKHHTLIHETGPRIRRTHKGEELVGEAEVPSNDTILTSTNIPRREPVEETLKSPSAVIDESTTPVTAHPEYTTPVHAEEDSSRPQTANRPPPIDTSTAEASRKRKFDLEKVWSHVESSDTKKIARQFPSRTPTSAISHHDVMEKIDKDIDMLLRDGEDQEMEDAEPPYSPKSFNDHYSPPPDDGGVWRGIIELEKICVLEATATLIGGPEYIQGVRWTDMVATHIAINGRIPMERASEYLEGHYYSSTCAVVCASIKPRTSANEDAFRQIFEYFHTRKRYAVVGQNRHVRLKDLYIIPLEADERVPQWWPALKPAATISDDQRDERLLLMTCVIHLVPKSQEPDGNGEGMNGAGETRTDGQASIAPLHSQQNQHAYYTYGNQYQPAAPPVNNTSQQLAYYSNNGNNASLAQPQQHYDQYYQSQQPYHPQQPQMQPQHQSQAQPQPQIQSPPYQPQDSHPQQQQVGAYFHHPLLGNFYQQHLYAQPPASSASTPQPPHHQSPQQPAGSSFLTMTQDLQTLVPGISHDDLVTINKLLEENPHLQTDATTLVKAVDKILGK